MQRHDLCPLRLWWIYSARSLSVPALMYRTFNVEFVSSCFSSFCTSKKPGLIIKWLKHAHTVKVFCNLRGLTQQGFSTVTPLGWLSPQPPPRFHFKGFRLKSYLLKGKKWLHCIFTPSTLLPNLHHSISLLFLPVFIFLVPDDCNIQFQLAYLTHLPLVSLAFCYHLYWPTCLSFLEFESSLKTHMHMRSFLLGGDTYVLYYTVIHVKLVCLKVLNLAQEMPKKKEKRKKPICPFM